MKILVTGSVGFIGFHCTKNLLEDGFDMYKQFQTESGVVVELVRWGKKD